MISRITALLLNCFLSLVFIALGAGIAVADVSKDSDAGDARKRHGKKPGHPHRDSDHERTFKETDTNQDGFLSLEEFSQMKRLASIASEKRARLFAFLDRNNDGKLHHRELHPSGPSRFAPVVKIFERLDADNSGSLSLEELGKAPIFKKTPADHLARIFEKIDRNNDQQLDKNELTKGGHRHSPDIHFGKYDTDNSGGLSFEEYSQLPFMNRVAEERRRKIFSSLDTNKDQQLTKDEIRKSRRPHRGPPRAGPDDQAPKKKPR